MTHALINAVYVSGGSKKYVSGSSRDFRNRGIVLLGVGMPSWAANSHPLYVISHRTNSTSENILRENGSDISVRLLAW